MGKEFCKPEIEVNNLSELDIVLTSDVKDTVSTGENTKFDNWPQWH